MLLEPSDWSLAQSSDVVLAGLSDELSAHTAPETHAAVVELATGVHQDVDGAVAELASLRSRLSLELDALGLTVAAAGTHPLTVHEETEVSGAVRYRGLRDSLRVLARREPTMALHVHVGVPAPEDAIRVLNGLRRQIPVLLALSANSPFWQGRDSGFASARTHIFQAFPRAGPPRFFADYADYTGAVDALIAPGAIPDPSFLVVGRAAAAGARDRRGAGDGRSVNGPRGRSVGRLDPVARPPRARGRDLTGGTGRGGSRREPFLGCSRRDGCPADRPGCPVIGPGARNTRSAARRLSAACRRARLYAGAGSGAVAGGRYRCRSSARVCRRTRSSRRAGREARWAVSDAEWARRDRGFK